MVRHFVRYFNSDRTFEKYSFLFFFLKQINPVCLVELQYLLLIMIVLNACKFHISVHEKNDDSH